jgi:hypothetical protein
VWPRHTCVLWDTERRHCSQVQNQLESHQSAKDPKWNTLLKVNGVRLYGEQPTGLEVDIETRAAGLLSSTPEVRWQVIPQSPWKDLLHSCGSWEGSQASVRWRHCKMPGTTGNVTHSSFKDQKLELCLLSKYRGAAEHSAPTHPNLELFFLHQCCQDQHWTLENLTEKWHSSFIVIDFPSLVKLHFSVLGIVYVLWLEMLNSTPIMIHLSQLNKKPRWKHRETEIHLSPK